MNDKKKNKQEIHYVCLHFLYLTKLNVFWKTCHCERMLFRCKRPSNVLHKRILCFLGITLCFSLYWTFCVTCDVGKVISMVMNARSKREHSAITPQGHAGVIGHLWDRKSKRSGEEEKVWFHKLNYPRDTREKCAIGWQRCVQIHTEIWAFLEKQNEHLQGC